MGEPGGFVFLADHLGIIFEMARELFRVGCGIGQLTCAGQGKRFCKDQEIRRELIKRTTSEGAETLGRVRTEKMRASIDCMYWLTVAGFSRVRLSEALVALAQARIDRSRRTVRE